MEFLTDLFADRISGNQFGRSGGIYKFEKIKKAKRETVASIVQRYGAEEAAKNPAFRLIDMGVGEPDEPACPEIVSTLAGEAGRPENRFYADNGIPEFQEAAARYLEKVYGVGDLDPYSEILHGIGSKPMLALLPLCFINPGDYTLLTVPGYPVLGTYTAYCGGRVYPLPLTRENGYLPDLDSIKRDVLKRTKLLYLNYPNNPTGATAPREFFQRVIDFARLNKILVVHDASYSALVYDGNRPFSFLSLEGAKDVGVELFSLSKSFNMTGWRLAFMAGSRECIKAYAAVKDNTDSGQFRAIQKAGVYALDHPEITEAIAARYSRRFDLLIPALQSAGFTANKPGGTFYCYVPAPKGTINGRTFASAAEVSDCLIRECLVSTVPWDDAGAYLRFSVTYEAGSENREREIMQELSDRLKKADFVF